VAGENRATAESEGVAHETGGGSASELLLQTCMVRRHAVECCEFSECTESEYQQHRRHRDSFSWTAVVDEKIVGLVMASMAAAWAILLVCIPIAAAIGGLIFSRTPEGRALLTLSRTNTPLLTRTVSSATRAATSVSTVERSAHVDILQEAAMKVVMSARHLMQRVSQTYSTLFHPR